MKKLHIILIFSSFICYNSLARRGHKNVSSPEENVKFELTDKQLKSDIKNRKRLQKKLKPKQFLMVLDELLLLRTQNKEYAERIKSHEELEATEREKFETMKQCFESKIAEFEEKLKNSSGNGDLASEKILKELKSEGIDYTKLRFRVQIGEMSTYKAAEAIKVRVRKLGLETWILPVYKGYVIPLSMIINHIDK